jgi:purine-binding chemotaxis protein CheW
METTKGNNSYLTFLVAEEEYALHVSKVLNILELTKITKVPKSPLYMKGVINLRGMVLPVLDTRVLFNLPETAYTDETCIIVLEIEIEGENVHLGTLVDQVIAVIEIENDEIEARPSIGNRYKAEYILGVAKREERFIMILDILKTFSIHIPDLSCETLNTQEI